MFELRKKDKKSNDIWVVMTMDGDLNPKLRAYPGDLKGAIKHFTEICNAFEISRRYERTMDKMALDEETNEIDIWEKEYRPVMDPYMFEIVSLRKCIM